MRLALIPGHGARTRDGVDRYDPGACHDDHVEAVLVRRLCAAVHSMAPERVKVFDTGPGIGRRYRDRRLPAQRWLVEQGGGAVVHVHCNGGGGAYSMTMPDPRSRLGASIAAELRDTMNQVPAILEHAKCKVVPANRARGWKHAANLVEPTYSETGAGIASVLIEWGFVDGPGAENVYHAAAIKQLATHLAQRARL